MANHKSAQKRIRQTIRRTEVNRSRKTKVKKSIKALLSAISGKDKKQSAELFKTAEGQIMKAAQKNLLEKKAASRKVSQLSKLVKNISAS